MDDSSAWVPPEPWNPPPAWTPPEAWAPVPEYRLPHLEETSDVAAPPSDDAENPPPPKPPSTSAPATDSPTPTPSRLAGATTTPRATSAAATSAPTTARAAAAADSSAPPRFTPPRSTSGPSTPFTPPPRPTRSSESSTPGTPGTPGSLGRSYPAGRYAFESADRAVGEDPTLAAMALDWYRRHRPRTVAPWKAVVAWIWLGLGVVLVLVGMFMITGTTAPRTQVTGTIEAKYETRAGCQVTVSWSLPGGGYTGTMASGRSCASYGETGSELEILVAGNPSLPVYPAGDDRTGSYATAGTITMVIGGVVFLLPCLLFLLHVRRMRSQADAISTYEARRPGPDRQP